MYNQVGGNHYTELGIEPIEVARAWLTPDELRGYYWATAIKYIGRWKAKGGVEDLLKAQHFLAWLIEHEQSEGAE